MHKWNLHTPAKLEHIEAERVFVEEGPLHIVHGKDKEAVSIYPDNKWIRLEYVEEMSNARKRPTKNTKAKLHPSSGDG